MPKTVRPAIFLDMDTSECLLLGLKNKVAAFSRADGRELWSTELGGMAGGGFVTLISEGDCVFAYGAGHLHCLDLFSGQILWSNDLPGFGYGLASLALPGGLSAPHPAAVRAMLDAERSSEGTSHVTSNT